MKKRILLMCAIVFTIGSINQIKAQEFVGLMFDDNHIATPHGLYVLSKMGISPNSDTRSTHHLPADHMVNIQAQMQKGMLLREDIAENVLAAISQNVGESILDAVELDDDGEVITPFIARTMIVVMQAENVDAILRAVEGVVKRPDITLSGDRRLSAEVLMAGNYPISTDILFRECGYNAHANIYVDLDGEDGIEGADRWNGRILQQLFKKSAGNVKQSTNSSKEFLVFSDDLAAPHIRNLMIECGIGSEDNDGVLDLVVSNHVDWKSPIMEIVNELVEDKLEEANNNGLHLNPVAVEQTAYWEVVERNANESLEALLTEMNIILGGEHYDTWANPTDWFADGRDGFAAENQFKFVPAKLKVEEEEINPAEINEPDAEINLAGDDLELDDSSEEILGT